MTSTSSRCSSGLFKLRVASLRYWECWILLGFVLLASPGCGISSSIEVGLADIGSEINNAALKLPVESEAWRDHLEKLILDLKKHQRGELNRFVSDLLPLLIEQTVDKVVGETGCFTRQYEKRIKQYLLEVANIVDERRRKPSGQMTGMGLVRKSLERLRLLRSSLTRKYVLLHQQQFHWYAA